MPLTSTSHRAKSDAWGVSFLMMDGENAVRVDVGRQLLANIGSSVCHSAVQDLGVFEKHRDDVEEIARAKYNGGECQRYANSCVVPITAADWQRHKG
jgi:Protein of unknown function (DUF1488)